MDIVFQYSEIALKGRNRGFYERILRQNIVNTLTINCGSSFKVYYKNNLGAIEEVNKAGNNNLSCIFNVLAVTPGIAWFGLNIFKLSIDVLKQANFGNYIFDPIEWIFELYFRTFGKQLEISVKRRNKAIKLTSQDIWIELRTLQHKLRKDKNIIKVKNEFNTLKEVPHSIIAIIEKNISKLHSLQIIIDERAVNVYARFNGVFGLPVGSTGKGLVLFSGGIDSPVSAFVAAKRGINFDLLHFSPHSVDEIKQTKIYEIYKKLKLTNPYARLFIASVPFLKQAKNSPETMASLYNPMIVFKRIIAKVACLLGAKLYKNEFVVISGDSLGQVSSQTISNLVAVNKAFYSTKIEQSNIRIISEEQSCLNRAVFIRPLSGMNKDEIINIAKHIGTYDLSIKDYIDCCSVLAKTSKTSTNLEKIQRQDKDLNMEEIVKQAFSTVQQVE